VGASIRALGALVACASILGACRGAAEPTTHATDAGAATDAAGEASPACFVPKVQDPSFATTTAWSADDEVVFAPGAVTFSVPALCDHRTVTQLVQTPPLACARPLVMSVTVALDDLDRVNFLFGLGGRWYAQLFAGTPTWTFCLGASAFGGAQTLAFSSAVNLAFCPPPAGATNSITFQRLSISEDVQGVCPPPGIMWNGDFEQGKAPWTLNDTGGIAALEPGLGEGASTGARLATDHPCEQPSIRGLVSLPTNAMVPNPALRIWSSSTNGAVASVRIGPRPPDYLLGATYLPSRAGPASAHVCLPRWAQGTVQPLELAFAPTEFTETCPTPRARELVFDGLAFVTEPACAAESDVFDSGFELAADPANTAVFWALQRYQDEPTSDVGWVVDPHIAHTGKVAARFTGSSPCPVASLSGGVTMPRADGENGPALKFWYDASATAHLRLDVDLGSLTGPVALPVTTGWKQIVACIDPRVATHPDLLTFSLTSADGGGTCSNTFAPETVLLDDVELTTDPSCAPR